MYFKLTRQIIKESIFLITALFAIPIYFFSEAGINTFYIMIPLIFIMQAYLCRALRNISVFLLLTIYAFIYFIYLIPYFYFGTQLSMWSEFQDKKLYILVCLQFYVFYSALCLSIIKMPNPGKYWLKSGLELNVSRPISIMIVLFTTIVILYLFKFGGENVLNSNNPYRAYVGNLEKSNVLGLLVLMFIVFCYFSIKNHRKRDFIVIIFSCAIAYFAITRGFRVMLAPLGFMFILLFLEQKLTVKSILILAFLGLAGLSFINALKMNEEFSLMYIFSTDDSFILSHQADELYGAAAANGLMKSGEITTWDRIGLQMSLIAQSVIPPSFFPREMRFPMVIMTHTGTGGGGLFVSGITLIFGYVGLFIITFLIAKMIQMSYSCKSKYLKLIVFFILMYSPNWFSYDLNVILRFPLIAITLYFLLSHIKNKSYKIA